MTERERILNRIEEIKEMDIYKELEMLYDELEKIEYDKIYLSVEQVNAFIRNRM